jgi:hypothetical protein
LQQKADLEVPGRLADHFLTIFIGGEREAKILERRSRVAAKDK